MRTNVKYYFLLAILILTSSHSYAGNGERKMDSLNALLQNATQDTTRLRIYILLGNECEVKDNLKYGEPALQLVDKLLAQPTTTNSKERKVLLGQKAHIIQYFTLFYHDGVSLTKEQGLLQEELAIYHEIQDTLNTVRILLGIIDNYKSQGDFYQALESCQEGLALSGHMNNKKAIARFLKQMGDIFNAQGDTTQAMENYQKSLSIIYDINDPRSIAYALITMAKGYMYNIPKALEYYDKAKLLLGKLKDTVSIRSIYGFIGSMYRSNNDLSRALVNYKKALSMEGPSLYNEECWDMLNSIGIIYCSQDKIDTALNYLERALKIATVIHDKPRISNTNFHLAQTYFKQKNLAKAQEYEAQALLITKENSFADNIRDIELFAVQIDSATGNYKNALMHYRQYIAIVNKLNSEEVRKVAVKEKFQEEYNRQKDRDKATQALKDEAALADKHKQNLITSSIAVGLFLVLVFAAFIFRSLSLTRKQKIDIENKNMVIEQKNKEVFDSITYAKRLQDAILPPLSLVKQYLPESFVLYKPKDIVAGDFYWMEKLGDTVLIAAADCTGHGVPGALVSVVCSNALNRTVKEFKITEPGKILDKVRELVLETFERSEDNVQDGMDISLVTIQAPSPPKRGNTEQAVLNPPLEGREALGSGGALRVQWAGANNALWYIQNNQMKEVAPNKQPIGKYYNAMQFNTNSLNLKKGDTLYLFTDGYADQFGGPKGKKFKYKQFQEKLLAISNKPLAEQKQELEKTLEEWKGNLEQVDDVLIIGIRV